uniref:Uncharacterized protein n=1 Tax=Ixodes ricinus TaxID=34613 RepID=A0A6B0U5N8_IXORI
MLWAILTIPSLKVCHVAFMLGTTARGSTMSPGRVTALDCFLWPVALAVVYSLMHRFIQLVASSYFSFFGADKVNSNKK